MEFDSPRDRQIDQFLRSAGWSARALSWLSQDASTRRYARTELDGKSVLLMDAPPVESEICTPEMTEEERRTAGWNAISRLAASRVDAFVLIAEHLRQAGLRPPEIIAHDHDLGFALLEDFGDGREFARLIARGAADEVTLYKRAASDLAKLHRQSVPSALKKGGAAWNILAFDSLALYANADLFIEWLPKAEPSMVVTPSTQQKWETILSDLVERANAFPRDFTLRDYHAENLLWLESGEVGILDFQDAVLGWDGWDMAMLTQDARRHVSVEAERAAIRSYLDATGKSEADFLERLAVIGALNALRITGLFARLQIRDKKPKYGQFMPRQQAMLAKNLRHPSLAELASFVRQTAPFIFEGSA